MPRVSDTVVRLNATMDGAPFSVDNQIGFLLRRAYQRASVNLMARIGSHRLTPPQFTVLARLYERGRLSQNLLGRLVAMEPPNIRDVILRLKKRGFVRSERDPADGRLIILTLTGSGKALVHRLIPDALESVAATLAPLTVREQQMLREFLRRIDGA